MSFPSVSSPAPEKHVHHMLVTVYARRSERRPIIRIIFIRLGLPVNVCFGVQQRFYDFAVPEGACLDASHCIPRLVRGMSNGCT